MNAANGSTATTEKAQPCDRPVADAMPQTPAPLNETSSHVSVVGRIGHVSKMMTPARPLSLSDRWTAASLSALAIGAGSIALGAPASIPLAAALAAAGIAITGFRARAAVLPEAAIAITDLDGAPLAVTARFAHMMEAAHRRPEPDGLAVDKDSALALHLLRRRALADGQASAVIAPFAVTITAAGDQLTTRISPTARAAAPTPFAHAATFVEAVPGPAAVIDRTGSVRAANGQFTAMAGAANKLADAIALDDGRIDRLAVQAAAEGVARVDADLSATQGRRVRLTAKPFPASEPGALTISIADVTEQSELEAQIAQSQKMQAIGQLAGGIAHDFNNVLTAIIGFSDLLLQNHRPSDPAFHDIMNIKQNAQRAAGLVKQLLAFSRRQTLRPTVLNLNDVVADLTVMLDRLLGETVKLKIEYGRDLWSVLADVSQVEQVIINLSVNARDAMPGGGTLLIRTRNLPASEASLGDTSGAADGVLLEIEDTGTGIKQTIIDKIFEPFFTTKAMGEGTGLGLSTVYGIVKQTGGTLTVKSEEGRGTTFFVFLPRTQAARPEGAAPHKPDSRAADLTGSATLLLVEDEEAIRAFAARALEAKGYRVLTAASGMEAVEIYDGEDGAIDLLLTDVIMPELDGPSLVRKLRADKPDLRVIFMSGYADGASVDELGGALFLPKPFTLKVLAEAVKAELSA